MITNQQIKKELEEKGLLAAMKLAVIQGDENSFAELAILAEEADEKNQDTVLHWMLSQIVDGISLRSYDSLPYAEGGDFKNTILKQRKIFLIKSGLTEPRFDVWALDNENQGHFTPYKGQIPDEIKGQFPTKLSKAKDTQNLPTNTVQYDKHKVFIDSIREMLNIKLTNEDLIKKINYIISNNPTVNVNALNNQATTPLILALDRHLWSITDLMLMRKEVSEDSQKEVLANYLEKKDFEVVKYLVDKNKNLKSSINEELLKKVINTNDGRFLDLFFNSNTQGIVNMKIGDEWPAMVYCAYNGYSESFKWFVDKCYGKNLPFKIDDKNKTDGWRPKDLLHYAIQSGNTDLVGYIMEQCPSLANEVLDSQERTVLVVAASTGLPAMINTVIEKGALLSSESKETALTRAFKGNVNDTAISLMLWQLLIQKRTDNAEVSERELTKYLMQQMINFKSTDSNSIISPDVIRKVNFILTNIDKENYKEILGKFQNQINEIVPFIQKYVFDNKEQVNQIVERHKKYSAENKSPLNGSKHNSAPGFFATTPKEEKTGQLINEEKTNRNNK